jgi:hypothetical protein
MGSINDLFFSSNQFELVDAIKGLNGIGNMHIFKKLDTFTPIENILGMKGFEGPYPEQKLPIVRWTLFPITEFDVPVSQGHRSRLTIVGRSAIPRIMANVIFSTGEEKNCEFNSSSFTQCQLAFSASTDLIHLKIVPHSLDDIGSMAKLGEAILLSRLEILDLDKTIDKDVKHLKSLFSNIDFLDGFGNMEGPYKKLALPVVIWGRGDFSRIGIVGENSLSRLLLIEWRPGEKVQAIDVVYRNTTIGHCMSGGQRDIFNHCQVDLPIGAKESDLILQYIGDKKILSNKMNNSVLYKRLQIINKND